MHDFDKVWDRNQVLNEKWRECQNGELAMWVADMDFPVPSPILDALNDRLKHPFFGYDPSPKEALKVVAEHYRRTYGCHVEDDWFVLAPSVMPGVNVGCMTAGGKIMYCTPMYSHIRCVAGETGLEAIEVPLKHENGYYSFDFDAMEKAVTPQVRSFILCNPHNPVGRIFTREELEKLQDFCLRHDITIVSDEIHCEFALDRTHIPLFSLNEKALSNTVTVSSAGKICNIPGIPIAFAIVPDPELRRRYRENIRGLFSGGGTFNAVALSKAYDGSCAAWKDDLRNYLRENRAYMEQRIAQIPGISVNHSEGTYLAWIDCSELKHENLRAFFKEKAKVIYNDGSEFGDGRFIRINFACPRSQLKEALDRTERAVKELLA